MGETVKRSPWPTPSRSQPFYHGTGCWAGPGAPYDRASWTQEARRRRLAWVAVGKGAASETNPCLSLTHGEPSDPWQSKFPSACRLVKPSKVNSCVRLAASIQRAAHAFDRVT